MTASPPSDVAAFSGNSGGLYTQFEGPLYASRSRKPARPPPAPLRQIRAHVGHLNQLHRVA